MLHYFAMCEWGIKGLLRTMCAVDVETSRAVFSGVNLDQCINNIRRLYRSRSKKIPPGLGTALDQLKIIAEDRNLILHYGGADKTAEGIVAAKLWLNLPDVQDERRVFSPESLGFMTVDLWAIVHVMQHFRHPPRYLNLMNQQTRAEAERPVAWRYKRPAAPQKSKSHRSPQR
jgi:hypothetical protein